VAWQSVSQKISFLLVFQVKHILLGTDSHVASLLGMTRIFGKGTFLTL